MANTKTILTLTPGEFQLIQDALNAYGHALDIRSMSKNELPKEIAEMKIGTATSCYQRVMALYRELT